MKVTVLFFARARELAGTTETCLTIAEDTSPQIALRDHILQKFPALKPLEKHVVLAVNEQYVGEEAAVLKQGDRLAVIPPISGG